MMDLEYRNCLNFSTRKASISTEDYVLIANAFNANVERIRLIGRLPAEVCFWSDAFSSARGAALERVTGFLNGPESDESRLLANQFFDRGLQAYSSLSAPERDERQWEGGVGNFELLVRDDNSKELEIGAQAILATMIGAAWAALESLSIDLWIAAVDCHSQSLGRQVAEKMGEKNISLRDLAGQDFSLIGKMGTFLHKSKKARMETFGDIRTHYKWAFGDEFDSHMFSGRPMLSTSEQVRHLFAHRSGIVDARFLEKTSNDPLLTHARDGERLYIDGTLTAICVDECVQCGLALVEFVDKWPSPT